MSPAAWLRDDPRDERLLVVDVASGSFVERRVRDLPAQLRRGDLVVMNDAATLPASLAGRTAAGDPIEIRLLAREDDGAWRAVLFGAGDWRTRTEDRPPPPPTAPGDRLRFDAALAATVIDVEGPRLARVRFDRDGAALWSALYRLGRPVQYAHVARPFALWHVQTAYAARPWASEMPSAGRPLTWDALLDLRRRGVEIARVTHAAGLSATGDDALDRRLPLRERYDLPAETIAAIARTRARGGRVIAIGTSVVRALEGCARDHGGALVPGERWTDRILGGGDRLAVVDGLLTGMHDHAASHFALLEAFAPRALLDRAWGFAASRGFLAHELGDSALVLRPPRPPTIACGKPFAMVREPDEARVAEIVRGARVVAVVGMKGDHDRHAPAHSVPAVMKARGIRIVPVNPTIHEALGVTALPRVGDLKERVDVIQIFRRPEYVTALADEIVALPPDRRPPVVWMQSGIVNEAAAEKLQNAGIEVVMDRCFAVDMSRFRR